MIFLLPDNIKRGSFEIIAWSGVPATNALVDSFYLTF